MPTVYDGLQTNVQAPGIAPAPEGSPKLNLPADGDPPNASTFAQAFKIVADYLAWHFKPQAKIGDWLKGVMAWRAANGHRRALIDHLGLPGGRIQAWNEMWERGVGFGGTVGPQAITGGAPAYDANFLAALNALASKLGDIGIDTDFTAAKPHFIDAGLIVHNLALSYTAIAAGSGHWLGRTVTASGGSSAFGFVPPTTTATYTTRHNVVSLVAGDTSGDYANLWRGPNACFDDDLSFAIEWEGSLEAADTIKHSIGVGFSIENAVTVGGSPAADYAVFALAPGGGNWLCNHAGGGTGASVSSGVAASTAWRRFRIEFHGANVADNGVRALRYYIDGAQVGGDVTTNIPATTAHAAASACIVNTVGGSGGKGLRLGPMRFVSNLYGADVG